MKTVSPSNDRGTVLPADEHSGGSRSRRLRPLADVTLAHVGHFNPDYSRNRIMAKALRRAGAAVLTVSDRRPFMRRTPHLARELSRLRVDALLVGFPGHADVAVARLAGRGAPVLFDAFVGLYETAVEDRELVARTSLRACRYTAEDRLGCRLAHRVIVDTDAHLRYFAEHIGVSTQRLRRLWVGADDDVMQPGPPPDDTTFRVFVYTSFVPLHGLSYVVHAAKVLERSGADIRFDIVGSGQTETEVRRLAADLDLRSVRFLGHRPYEDLPALMAASHLCLGVFGTSGKAARVIPNKVFDALAVARPVLTADTPAAREVLTHGENAWLCPPGDPEVIAESIVTLSSDAAARKRLAEEGHRLFMRRFSIDALSVDVATLVLDAIGSVDHG